MSYYYSGGGSGFFSNLPKVTRNILFINVIFFVATLVNQEFMTRTFALFYPSSRYFHFWQPVTYMFMHGGFWHILFNMYTLVVFGSVLERMIGERKFLIFYMLCGLGAAACHMAVQSIEASSFQNGIVLGSQAAMRGYATLKMIPTLGASGAVYGVLIGYAMLFPETRLTLIFPPVSFSAKWMVVIFAAIELFTGVTGTAEGVAHFAHLGGMAIGWILIRWWRDRGTLFDRENL